MISRRFLTYTYSARGDFFRSTNRISRPFSTSRQLFAQKDAQDKDSLKPRSTEYSKSGSDDDAAANSDAAFNPNKTNPEEELDTSEEGHGGEKGPLNASPANQKISQPRDQQEGGAQGSPRTSSSGGGSAPKAGGDKSG
ncbi:hypothetical protein B0J11DRAFT_534546 [Dendryphion nanum]|uniref:Uncharacterized protein n=1 Tax=Dendryphion nanum TaxID=256645 RepID=A0A9P9DJH3_9PLEO|nr:hypothetical protein B0J11DRAFT_534546 [Dendryphion nanum]